MLPDLLLDVLGLLLQSHVILLVHCNSLNCLDEINGNIQYQFGILTFGGNFVLLESPEDAVELGEIVTNGGQFLEASDELI